MLGVSSNVFCSMSLLFDYMCMRLPFLPWSIAGVPSSKALPGFLITAPPLDQCFFKQHNALDFAPNLFIHELTLHIHKLSTRKLFRGTASLMSVNKSVFLHELSLYLYETHNQP